MPATTPLTVDLESAMAILGLEQRLRDTPRDATVRGLFFGMVEGAVRKAGVGTDAAWRRLVHPRFRWPFSSYPLRDHLRELAYASALLDPAAPLDAMRRIWSNAPTHAPRIHAAKFVAMLLGGDPMTAFRWLGHNRRLFCNYGEWRVEQVARRRAIFHFWDEYLWIDAAHRGGAEGSLRVFGAAGEVHAELVTPYEGRLHIQWD